MLNRASNRKETPELSRHPISKKSYHGFNQIVPGIQIDKFLEGRFWRASGSEIILNNKFHWLFCAFVIRFDKYSILIWISAESVAIWSIVLTMNKKIFADHFTGRHLSRPACRDMSNKPELISLNQSKQISFRSAICNLQSANRQHETFWSRTPRGKQLVLWTSDHPWHAFTF
jgi:hypothetical protein